MYSLLKFCLVGLALALASQAATAQGLCDRVREIKVIPHKDERVDDAAYNALTEAGERAVPCLIEKVADPTPMPDPRQAPKISGTRVGDVALFVLADITKLDFVAMLPASVRGKFKNEGIYAYHEFAAKRRNRGWLRRRLRAWRDARGKAAPDSTVSAKSAG